MNRRQFIKLVTAGTISAVLPRPVFSLSSAVKPTAKRPNIIIILADDMGWTDPGCYGNQTGISTPNIDALAAGGMKFTDFHSNGPVCSPTRAALLTGRYSQRAGIEAAVLTNIKDKGMAQEQITLAEVLKSVGYATALFGKWHLGYKLEFNPANQGFDLFKGYVAGNVDYHSHCDNKEVYDWWENLKVALDEGYTTCLIEEYATKFIEQNKDRPFCLYLAHEFPHDPLQGPTDGPMRCTDTPDYPGDWADQCRRYKDMIEAMDQGIGRMLNKIKTLGLERNTFIFFFSDNGPQGNRPGTCDGLNGKKGDVLEGGHRVPGIAYWPGKITPGTVTGETAMGMDLFPTIAAIAGAKLPTGPDRQLDGVNLLPLLLNGEPLLQRCLFWRFEKINDPNDRNKAVRKGPWKLVVKNDGTRLYNLDSDLGETIDLSSSNPSKVAELRAELDAWEAQMNTYLRQS